MQYDELEDFIRANRDEFDDQLPSAEVWDNIAKYTQPRKSKMVAFRKFFSMAATIAVLLVCGILFGQNVLNRFEQHNNKRLPKDFSKIEQNYLQKITLKYKELAEFEATELVDEDLIKIDELIVELKKELLYAPQGTEDLIMNHILKSYQMKLKILERVLNRVQVQEPQPINVVDDETIL